MILIYAYWIGVIAFFLWIFHQSDQDNEELRKWNPNAKVASSLNIFIISIMLTLQFGLFWPISWFFVRRGVQKEREKTREQREWENEVRREP